MIFDIKPYERRIFELVQDAGSELGYEVYVVGGFVRDRLLGLDRLDMEVASGPADSSRSATGLVLPRP